MVPLERAQPEPFHIATSQAEIDDLSLRLGRTRWTTIANEESSWAFGTAPSYLRALVEHWRTRYDWRRHESRLNALPQFTATLDGARVHFVHMRGRGPRPTPLLLLHGFPDSFYRFHRVIVPFATPEDGGSEPEDAFDVVVPSLPGFAFSERVPPRASQPARASARRLWQLMTEVLGYERFLVAGGDRGGVLAQLIAIDHPESVLGVHLTDLGPRALEADPESLSPNERKYVETRKKRASTQDAFALVQKSQPRSLAAALDDSPVGLASWIVDRFHETCADMEASLSKDDLLTNIMLYWTTRSIGSSVFSYHADARSPSFTARARVERPVALALFPSDPGGVPLRSLAERTLNVRRWTEMPRGGHFAALEEPELFVEDLIEFSRELRDVRSRPETEARHVVSVF